MLSPMSRLVVLGADEQWSEQLRARGWTTHHARDVAAAIDLALSHQPQVVVVAADDIGSFHFVRSLRGAVDHDLKIVAVASQISLELGAAGFDVIVPAPVDFDTLQLSIAVTEDYEGERRATTRIPVVSKSK
jgi:DNA-binding response OmpR family regulator